MYATFQNRCMLEPAFPVIGGWSHAPADELQYCIRCTELPCTRWASKIGYWSLVEPGLKRPSLDSKTRPNRCYGLLTHIHDMSVPISLQYAAVWIELRRAFAQIDEPGLDQLLETQLGSFTTDLPDKTG